MSQESRRGTQCKARQGEILVLKFDQKTKTCNKFKHIKFYLFLTFEKFDGSKSKVGVIPNESHQELKFLPFYCSAMVCLPVWLLELQLVYIHIREKQRVQTHPICHRHHFPFNWLVKPHSCR
jgi:hypothetical protein